MVASTIGRAAASFARGPPGNAISAQKDDSRTAAGGLDVLIVIRAAAVLGAGVLAS
jgi:hypothetical protein